MLNVSNLRKSLVAATVALAVVCVPFSQLMAQDTAAAASSSTNQTVPGKVDDSWITTKVKSELATTKGIKSTDISVTTTEGAVTLTGTVATAKEKKHAVHVAKKVKGVKSVDASGLTVSAAS